jgi:hypothetical protein
MTSTVATNKPFHISKRQVYEAYKVVKSNRGSAGVDGQTLEIFVGEILALENPFGELDLGFFEISRAERDAPGLFCGAVVPGSIPEVASGIGTFGEPVISDFESGWLRSLWFWHVRFLLGLRQAGGNLWARSLPHSE